MLFFLIVPSKPANFKVIEAKDGGATLSWNEPLHKNGKIVKYNLIYRVLDDGKRIVMDIQKDKQLIVLSNLISNARYSFILSASTSAGTGETEEIEFDFSKSEFLKIGSANIFLFKVTKRNTRKRCEICSKLAIKHQNDVMDVVLVF